MDKVLFSLTIIVAGLGLGWAVRMAVDAGRLRLPVELPRLRVALQKTALLWVLPLTYCGAIWNLSLRDVELVAMPFVGGTVFLTGGFLALAAAKPLGLSARQTGAFYCCGSFTNIGAVGAMVCHTFLGEAAFALVPAYKLFEEIVYFSFGFPLAKAYAEGGRQGDGAMAGLRRVVTDPFIIVALSSMLLGGVLNLSGLERPSFFPLLNSILVPTGSLMMLFSIGLAMRFTRLGKYRRECAVITGIKFVCMPILATGAAAALGFGSIMGGAPLKVVLILSSMPVAFTALIPPSIYDLDIDLANACWFTSTLALIVVLPTLFWLTGVL
jgi:predicted permease